MDEAFSKQLNADSDLPDAVGSFPLKGRVLGIDWGDARVGVALTDPLRITANPYRSIDTNQKLIGELIEILKKEQVAEIVIGLPKELSGQIGPQAEKVLKFVEKLKMKLAKSQLHHIKIHLWDERMTTVQASRVVAGSKLKNRARREALDRISAALILEGYLGSV